MPKALVKSFPEMPIIDSNDTKGFSTCPLKAKEALLSDGLREEFLPFVSEGFVSLNESCSPVPIRILRDTGASQSLLLASVLPFSDESATGDINLVQGIEGRIVSVPLHSLYLKSDLVTGQVKVGLRSSLPVKGVSLLLGNDLAGGKVVPSVQMSVNPVSEEVPLDSDIFPSCAVTRSMAKKSKAEEVHVQSSTSSQRDSCDDSKVSINSGALSDTFVKLLFDQDLGKSQSSEN